MSDSSKSIKLTRSIMKPFTHPGVSQHLWAMEIQAEGLGGVPNEVFLFQQKGTFYDPYPGALFVAVASAHDLQETPTEPMDPENTPSESEFTPFYRRATVNLFLRYPEELEELWKDIREDIAALVVNLEAAEDLTTTDTFTAFSDGSTEMQETT